MDTTQLATKNDLANLGLATHEEFDKVRAEIKSESTNLRSEIQSESANLRSEMKAEFDGVLDTLQLIMMQMDAQRIDFKSYQTQQNETASRMMGWFDSLEKQLETQNHEFAAFNSQLNRHDRWIHQLAAHNQLKLT